MADSSAPDVVRTASSLRSGGGMRVDVLVIEFLQGLTRAERLDDGALPLDQALRDATEIAD